MQSLWIIIGVLFVSECSILVFTSPVTPPTVEYLDSSSATAVVFDESGADNRTDENNENLETTTTYPETDSDDEIDVPTTALPCGNDVDSPDCNSDSSDILEIALQDEADLTKTANNNNTSEEKGTTVEPPKEN